MEVMLFAARIRWKRADESDGEALFAQSASPASQQKAALDLHFIYQHEIGFAFTFYFFSITCITYCIGNAHAQTLFQVLKFLVCVSL